MRPLKHGEYEENEEAVRIYRIWNAGNTPGEKENMGNVPRRSYMRLWSAVSQGYKMISLGYVEIGTVIEIYDQHIGEMFWQFWVDRETGRVAQWKNDKAVEKRLQEEMEAHK